MHKIEVRGPGNEKMDADLSARVNASVDVELQLVAVLQLEAEARPLLLQAAPVQDGIDAFLSLSSCLCLPVFVFLSLSSCLCLPVFVHLCSMAIWLHKISASSM